MNSRNLLVRLLLIGSLMVMLFVSVPFAAADNGTDSSALREAVTLAGVRAHQAALQAIADANGGSRVAGFPGHDLSAQYVFDQLTAAGYSPVYQEFMYTFFNELETPILEQTSPNPTVYPPNDVAGFATMEYSGNGDVTALVQATNDIVIPPAPVANTSNSGCEAADFAGFVAGSIALVQRGTCTFYDKALNAQNAGAVGVIIFNEGQPGRTDVFAGTLGAADFTIPVVGAAFAVGEELYNLSQQPGGVTMHMFTHVETTDLPTVNVLADTAGGRADRLVVVGAHLDSVPAGPGINDNGSGSAAILEVAIQMAELGIEPRNKVRFAWWSAEESGLLGSAYYVSQLSNQDIKKHAANLNFDMIGSPNYVSFIYDGDGSGTGTAGPNGSDVVEAVFLDYFASQGLPNEPTAFDGRSDYGPFIDVGIPAGGLFTGAEGIKTQAQADVFGGTAGLAYDPCYHQACDTYANNSDTALDLMSDATAHATLTFAMTTSSVNGTDKGKGHGQSDFDYSGSSLKK